MKDKNLTVSKSRHSDHTVASNSDSGSIEDNTSESSSTDSDTASDGSSSDSEDRRNRRRWDIRWIRGLDSDDCRQWRYNNI